MTATWSCAACSTTNAPADERCAVCGASRVAPPAPATSTPGAAPAGAPAAAVHRHEPGTAAGGPNQPSGGGGWSPGPVGPATAAPTVPVVARVAAGTGRQAAGSPPSGPATTAVAPPAGGAGDGSGGGRTALLVALVAVLAVAVGVGAFLLVSGGGSEGDATADDPAEQVERSEGDTGSAAEPEVAPREVTVDEPEPVEVVTTTTTAPPPATRTAFLWAGNAKLRGEPRLDGPEVRSFTDRAGLALTILGPLRDGWYEVEIDGSQGYLYAGLVAPPETGYCVVYGPDAWVSSYGSSRLLVTSHDEWEHYAAIYPDGRTDLLGDGTWRDSECG